MTTYTPPDSLVRELRTAKAARGLTLRALAGELAEIFGYRADESHVSHALRGNDKYRYLLPGLAWILLERVIEPTTVFVEVEPLNA